MFKISAFSKMSRISVKTLRYYDELGLLKPTAVDEFSGYRYYSADQLLTVERIIAYKELGLSLEQIIPLVTGQATPADAQSTLAEKRVDLENVIRDAQKQLADINIRMQSIEKTSMKDDNDVVVTLRPIEPQLAASIRDTIPRANICLLVNEVREHVQASGGEEDGPLTILWHDFGGEDERIDIEIAIQLTKSIPNGGRVKVGHLPSSSLAASLVHSCNPYASSCSSTSKVAGWMASNGYQPSESEPVREVYLASEKDMYGSVRKSEVFIPIANEESR